MDSLIPQTSARGIRRALKRLPEKLNDTFDEAMDRTATQPEEHAVLANQVLSWIFYAKRPLSLTELREALSVEPGDRKLDRSGGPELDLLLNVCCGLVTVDEQDNVIRLVHYSLQQYFEENWKTDVPRANWGIAMACLTYLMLDDFSPEAVEETELPTSHGQESPLFLPTRAQWRDSHKFFSYVASYWSEHVRGTLEKELEPLILQVFKKKMHLLYSLQEHNKLLFRNVEYETWPHEPSPLHLTSYWGLAHITRRLIAQGFNVEIQDSRQRTPLVCAALNGHCDIAYDLLDSGANVHTKDIADTTLLHVAIANDHFDFARLLLIRDVDVNALDKKGYSPMCFAACNGSLKMIALLFENGANAEKSIKPGISPLEIASREGYLSIVQWLLVKGVDINAQRVCPLIEAVYGNHLLIVRVLMSAGAALDRMNEFGHTALSAAVMMGNVDVAQCLLLAGAASNDGEVGPERESPLQIAAYKGDYNLVDSLIRQGADVYAKGGERGSVLQNALYSQDLEVIRMILDWLSCENIHVAQGAFGTTPLQLAVMLKNAPMLSLLLSHRSKSDPEADIQVNRPNAFGVTPLHQALYLGWTQGVEMLSRAGGDSAVHDVYGRTALEWAQNDKHLRRQLRVGDSNQLDTIPPRKRMIKSSILHLIPPLLKDFSRKHGRRVEFHYLGHCLLQLNEVEEARTSFEQQILDPFAKHEPEHNILCASCKAQNNIRGSRFVCFTCADMDLCQTHRKSHLSKPHDPRCRKHQFLEVPGPEWQFFGNGTVNQAGEDVQQWLKRLLLSYTDDV